MGFLQTKPGQDLGQADILVARVGDDKDKHVDNDGVEDGDNNKKKDTTAHVRTT